MASKSDIPIDPEQTEIEEAPLEKKLEIESSGSEYSSTFILREEDHTIGNALRHVLAEDQRIELVGYSIPHPLENKLHIRIQTLEKNPDGSATNFHAVDGLKAGCQELKDRGAILIDTFERALSEFNANK